RPTPACPRSIRGTGAFRRCLRMTWLCPSAPPPRNTSPATSPSDGHPGHKGDSATVLTSRRTLAGPLAKHLAKTLAERKIIGPMIPDHFPRLREAGRVLQPSIRRLCAHHPCPAARRRL